MLPQEFLNLADITSSEVYRAVRTEVSRAVRHVRNRILPDDSLKSDLLKSIREMERGETYSAEEVKKILRESPKTGYVIK
jgi:hypothetical protein